MKVLLSISIALFITMSGCRSGKLEETTTAQQHPLYKITIGQGGGFTGKYSEYQISNAGFIKWVDPHSGEVFSEMTVPEDTVSAWNAELKATSFHQTKLEDDGNFTRYIIFEKDSATHRVSWSHKDNQPEASITTWFFKIRAQILKKIEE